MSIRPSKEDYYLNIAEEVARRGTCLRRLFGAVIVQDDQIISTGYVGAPRGSVNCIDLAECPRQKANIPPGERYELCRSVHAEMNAIIHASRREMLGSTIYLACLDPQTGARVGGTRPCKLCTRMIINAGIERVIVREADGGFSIYSVADWVKEDTAEWDAKRLSGY